MRIWRRLADLVAAHGAAALVSVREAEGSTPREAGAAMAVRPDGAFHGTIGGGRLEWEALQAAGRALREGRGPALAIDQALGPDLGQCCGGRVRVLVETFDLRDRAELEALAEAEEAGAFEVACALDAEGRVQRSHPSPSPGRMAPPPDPSPPSGRVAPQGPGGEVLAGNPPTSPPVSLALATLPGGGEGLKLAPWAERWGQDLTPLLLFGAGHVGRAVVLALAPLPFRIRWCDPRPEAFPPHVPANATTDSAMESAIDAAPPGAFVLVMTHDHGLDLALTAAALKRPDFPFVGLIGSATKRARFERRLRSLGLPPERIAGLACPIGVPGIAGKEPAVIAAAVAAQLLQERERIAARLSPPAATRGKKRA